MAPTTFRIINLCWAAVLAALFIGELRDPDMTSVRCAMFWGLYLLSSCGAFFDLRVSWVACISQLVVIWLLVGVVVSDHSFAFFSPGGAEPGSELGEVTGVIMNIVVGILLPASGLLILLMLSHRHLRWVLTRRPLRGDAGPGRLARLRPAIGRLRGG